VEKLMSKQPRVNRSIRIKTVPDLAATSPAHQAAIQLGDEHFRLWQRNVIDEFKPLSNEEIKARLAETSFPYAVLMENLISDFNIATCIRNANAFNAKEVFYIGDKKFDRRGLTGVHNYLDIRWLATIEEFLQLKTTYKIVGFDNVQGAKPIAEYDWAPNTLVVFGSEGVGISPAMQDMCDELVFIPQFGSVRSLNVGTASGICMNDIVQKFRKGIDNA
jgi:tRNA G18 (ribose-2'-O)-methylase SpoU